MEKIKKRLNQNGMSLSETLVTVLIFSIVMAAVVSGSSASLSVYKQVRQKADAQTLLSTGILAVSQDMYSAKDVVVSGDSVCFYCDTRDGYVKYVNSYNDDKSVYRLLGQKSSDGSIEWDDSSTESVLTSKTETLDEFIQIQNLSYDTGTRCFTFTMQVCREGKVVETQDVTVRSALAVKNVG